jgi:hypothetical protein
LREDATLPRPRDKLAGKGPWDYDEILRHASRRINRRYGGRETRGRTPGTSHPPMAGGPAPLVGRRGALSETRLCPAVPPSAASRCCRRGTTVHVNWTGVLPAERGARTAPGHVWSVSRWRFHRCPVLQERLECIGEVAVSMWRSVPISSSQVIDDTRCGVYPERYAEPGRRAAGSGHRGRIHILAPAGTDVRQLGAGEPWTYA